jgi:serine/threonine-protein kinase HipA
MPRRRQHMPLRVLLNNRPVGNLLKEPGGAVSFRYDDTWLSRDDAIPVSLSLPLREDAYRGQRVLAVFENLLPDSPDLRERVAEKVGANGTDAYSLLSQIGRDCVGALQFVPEADELPEKTSRSAGTALAGKEMEKLLRNLVRSPLGMDRDVDFRISVAGAQEKTALLRHEGKWWKPRGATPTTHIFKTQIGRLPNGLDLSNSIENEYYCLKLIAAFGLPVNSAEIKKFGGAKALVVERFDRAWTREGLLLRVPQEDFCQALSCPPGRKYQSEGGPGMVEMLKFLQAGDSPAQDQKMFLQAQILFWLIGATDGHAKNFSIFLGPRGRFHMTPLYDVLTAQPSLDSRQIERKNMKLAMSAGDSRHYKIDDILGRHFIQTAERAGLPGSMAGEALEEIADTAGIAISTLENGLPPGFPERLHLSVKRGVASRLNKLRV